MICPGFVIIDLSPLRNDYFHTKDIGSCSVCDIGKAVYYDREAGTRICQQCYDREALAVGSANGGAGQ